MLARSLLFGAVAVALVGCAPKPPMVSIRWNDVPTVEEALTVAATPSQSKSVQGAQATQQGRPASRLYSSMSEQDVQGVLESLREARAKAFDRALQDLRKQYMTSIDAAEAEARGVVRSADEEDWKETSLSLRELLEQYAPHEGVLRMRLVALRDGLPREKQAITLADELRESIQKPVREKVTATTKELDDYVAEFERLVAIILTDYRGRRANRFDGVKELREDLTARYERDAQRQAKEIVDTSLRNRSTFDLILNERLEAVAPVTVQSRGLSVRTQSLGGTTVTVPRDVQLEAKIFAETRGYRLNSVGRDVTKEFIEWRKKQKLGR